jgi:hypothetical protein
VVLASYQGFFTAAASAAAALIGLLFVAVSVAPQRLAAEETRVESQIRAGAALVAFTDVLVISLVGLIPNTGIGWITMSAAVGGIAFSAASGRSLREEARRGFASRRSFVLVAVLVMIFTGELIAGIVLVGKPHDKSGLDTVCGLLIGSTALGIARAWQLVGMRDTGLFSSVSSLIHGSDPAPEPDPAE